MPADTGGGNLGVPADTGGGNLGVPADTGGGSSASKGGAGQTSQDQAIFFCDQLVRLHREAFGKPPTCSNQVELKEFADEAKTLGWTDSELDKVVENLHEGIKFQAFDGLDSASIRNVCRQIQIVQMPEGSPVCIEEHLASYIVQVDTSPPLCL